MRFELYAEQETALWAEMLFFCVANQETALTGREIPIVYALRCNILPQENRHETYSNWYVNVLNK
jgi:hypothetical protein